ncbi:bromodomain and WD repeat-containing protein 3 isoform X2 [Anoplophora glabripennis]|uniref:bromodomain and WD repeat-containing protein 3 isoform X2 n=1 Tax=Anoplophora glabripennis TaxID=217634 RepID=UPI000874DBD1|nr:bromodomain and WD repeat-containing protein 3 isoform X2 [Anoplophora glabripennis]
MEADKSLTLISDVYFLIQRFLSAGLLKKTLKVFNEELEENKILPRRIDWEGNEHERTVEDMIKQFPNIRPDYLLQLCYQATNSSGITLYNNKSFSSFLSFKPNIYNENNVLINFRQYFNYVARKHGVPIQKLTSSCNIINSIRGREVSGPLSRHRAISPRLYEGIRIQRTTLGHLSAVYCLLFDHSGKYIITGADDLLIKLWSAYTGRLIAAFRGANSEITDIAINSENTLLAAGSIDRILRVWNLQTGTPLAVLTGHTGMITSVNFCPTPSWGVRYLISTSGDGSIAFWTYTYDSCGKVEFRNTPILYQEKIRPGQAQMICSSFSPGGTFLATGSADHNVRVYYMKGDEGPHRILEIEAHSDRVDSIQWAHSGLRFLSGSKDGMAIIWWFERQQWKSIHLDMTAKLSNATNTSEPDPKKLKVTMVCWNKSDDCVVTAVSDHTLKIWTVIGGQLEKILPGHTDEIYVLESHPHDNNIILSAGHDGQLFIWDILKGEIVFRFLNTIEGQGYGAIFDVKWSPNGSMIAASDSHGHILTFGFGTGSPLFEQLPKELFFHTDYRPLVRDSNHYVLDEQTQIPPHLMPPPFLVDMDGNPYPPMLQRLVPGREFCNVEQLVPNIVIGNEGTQEVIQDIPQNHLPAVLEENQDEDLRIAGSSFRPGRRNRDTERIRHSTGEWQRDPNIEWKKNVLVQTLKKSILDRAKEVRECIKDAEMEEYQKQLRQRPHMISINTSNNIKRKEEKKKKNSKYVTRATKTYEYKEEDHTESSGDYSESSGYSDWMAEEGLEPPKRSKRRQVVHSKSSDQEDDEEDDEEEEEEDYYDDEDEPRSSKENHVSRSSRENSRSTRENHSGRNSKESSAGRSSKENHVGTSSKSRENGVAKVPKTAMPSTSGIPRSKMKVSEQYRLSEWLSETRPRKSPYYPQMGDEIVYFIQGHQLYLDAVQLKNIYEISAKDLPWNKMPIRDHEFVKVIGIQYEIKPPRLCCLKLALLDEEGRLTGKVFIVKYHDMPDVLDFFVLKQMYDMALSRNWQIGDKFRCMIDDEWWIGHVINKSPASELYPYSSFMCYEIGWNNGEQERMSPWDMEPIDPERLPEDENQSVPVLEPELNSIIYKSTPEDWPNSNRQSVTQHIVAGITTVMGLAIAEPFLVPVDINVYPSYAFVIEYPIDLSTIKSRFENNFYRRLTAAQFDIRYLATNAEKFNERHSIIVKHARILTELCLRIVKHSSEYVDVPTIYHQLVDTYDSSDTEDEVEILPSSSRNLRILPNRSLKDANDWKLEARNLIDALWDCEDSVPFRVPVNLLKYPDYQKMVKNPMDLGTVKENLINDKYEIPQQFCTDMRLIFQNSRLYNTNKRSRIYVMTVRLSAIFEEYIKKIIYNWKAAKRRNSRRRRSRSSASNNSSISSSICFSSDEERRSVVVDEGKEEIESDDSDNMPLTVLRSKTNTESDTSQSLDKIVQRSKKNNPDSEEEYCPSSRGKRTQYKITTSEEDEEELSSDESEQSSRKTNLRARPVRRKVHLYRSSDSDDSSSVSTRNKRQRLASDSDSDSKSSRAPSNDGTFMSSVSSRGRVRKLTERAKALFKRR